MDTKAALAKLTNRAQHAFKADQDARTALSTALTECAATDLTALINTALVASANAKPWQQLMQRIEHHDVRKALTEQKAEALELLLTYGTSMTSLVASAAHQAEQDGLRRFLNAVDTIEIDEDTTSLAG